MRPETKLKVARRKHTVELLRWLYSRRDPHLDGTRLSLDHRGRQPGGLTRSRHFTYGEVDIPDFLSILDLVAPRHGEVFVDLGSGTGKAVLASACGFPEFSKCLGIELVGGLVSAANDHLNTGRAALGKASTLDARDPEICGPSGVAKAPPLASHQARAGASSDPSGLRGNARGGKKVGRAKANGAGLTASDFEELIARLLHQHASSPRRAPQDGVVAATAEDVASWLVRDLGHRRYKASLRGFGGLQKFLVARAAAGSDEQSRLLLLRDEPTLTVALAPEGSPMVTHDTSPLGADSGEPAESGVHDVSEKSPSEAAGAKVTRFSPMSRTQAGIEGCLRERTSFTEQLDQQPEAKRFSAGPHAREASELQTDGGPFYRCGDTPPDPLRPSEATRIALSAAGLKDCDRIDDTTAVRAKRRPSDGGPLTPASLSHVEFVCGDIFEEAWDDAGVVYVASLLFDDDMMMRLGKALAALKTGARVISLRPIPRTAQKRNTAEAAENADALGSETVLRPVHEGLFRMSWQMARVYIYERS